jgi:hypothetical protein
MKLKDSEKALILGLVGAVILVVAVMYVIKPNWESVQSLNAQAVELQARLDELQVKEADREEYLAKTEEYNNGFDEILESFPADLNQEVTIMFMQGIKDDNDFDISSLGLGEKTNFYTLGLNGGDASLETDASADTATSEETTEATTEAATDTALVEGEYVDSSAYNCYKADFPINYTGSYDALKDVIAYVDTYQDRMTVNSVDISYDAEADEYSGSLQLACYSIESDSRPERKLELNDVEIGVDNIFQGGSGSGSGSSDSSLNKYDDNDGASIESNYDFYAMLNPATSDVSAKVVGQNGTGKESSVISNSDDSVSTLSFEFYEKDGKNYCKYTLDTTSYEAEVTSAEDIKLLLQSSSRKDDNDNVGIRVTINNTTSLPVYVKVSGDDATSPRVTVASKTGSVKVYK